MLDHDHSLEKRRKPNAKGAVFDKLGWTRFEQNSKLMGTRTIHK